MSSSTFVFNLLQGPSEQNQKISADINAIKDELISFLGMNDFFEYAQNFDLNETKVKLNKYLDGKNFKDFQKKWAENPGIEYVSPDVNPEAYPKGKICIQIKKDALNVVDGFQVHFTHANSAGNFTSFDIDLSNSGSKKLEEQCKIVRDNNLTYLKKDMIKNIDRELDEIFNALESPSADAHKAKIISQFNEKWKDKLEMKLTFDAIGYRGTVTVKDKFGFISTSCSSSSIQSDSMKNIEREIEGIYDALQSANAAARAIIISQFNNIWKDKFEMKLTFEDEGYPLGLAGTLRVKDKFGIWSASYSSNCFASEIQHVQHVAPNSSQASMPVMGYKR